MNFPLYNHKRNFNYYNKKGYLHGFHTSRNLQWTLSGAGIPYSLAHVAGDGWLVGDESGNILPCNPDQLNGIDPSEGLKTLVQLQSGVSEIAPLDRSKILVGEMRGNVSKIDLNNLDENSIVKGILHMAPIKCIRWQPNQSEVFATAGQDGSVYISDLRCPDGLISSLYNSHQLSNPSAKSRSTMTGLVFNPLRPEFFYTTGTPDTCVRLWDMRKLKCTSKTRSNRKMSTALIEEFSTSSFTTKSTRKHRSSVALTIDSIGSRLFLATSNDNIFEFLTNNPELGPVASYTASGFTSCSFFSNLSIDPGDRFLLSGSSNGQAFIWDTLNHDNCAYELPICAQLEVSKTAWAGGTKGSLDAQIACISDDLTFSLFNWNLEDETDNLSVDSGIKRVKRLPDPTAKEIIHKADEPTESQEIINNSNPPSVPSTPVRKKPALLSAVNTPSPNSANKSILDFFSRSPRVYN